MSVLTRNKKASKKWFAFMVKDHCRIIHYTSSLNGYICNVAVVVIVEHIFSTFSIKKNPENPTATATEYHKPTATTPTAPTTITIKATVEPEVNKDQSNLAFVSILLYGLRITQTHKNENNNSKRIS